MKKFIISILLCVLTIGLCACHVKTTTYSDNQKKFLSNQFTVIKRVSKASIEDNTCYYLYDNETKIMYLYTCGGYHATMCPYYTIVDGKPELAIYGVNWTE